MSSAVGCRLGSDLTWLWLCLWPAATAPIQPLAWEPPYAAGAAQEIAKKKRQKRTKIQSSHHGSVVMNPTSIHEDAGLIPGLAQWVKDPALQ